jgi:hypothetical protein
VPSQAPQDAAAKTALEGVYSWRERTLKKRALSIEIDRLDFALSLLAIVRLMCNPARLTLSGRSLRL